MTGNPETHRIIYLEPEVCADPSTGPLWCQDDCGSDHPETGEPVHWTPYVLKSEYDAIQRERDEAADEIDRLRSALEFYADPSEHIEPKCAKAHDRCDGGPCPYCETEPMPDFYSELDFGRRAREALAGET